MVEKAKPSTNELLFLQVISMFQAAAMQQMGKIMDPLTGKVSMDLDQAKVSIDFLEVLKEKTVGNLTQTEADLLDKVLFELHMNYVDETKRASETEKDQPDDEGEEKTAKTTESIEQEESGKPAVDREGRKGTEKDQKDS